MVLKKIYQILSLASIIFGLIILFSSKLSLLGAVTGIKTMQDSIRLGFSLFFTSMGALLFIIQSKDKNLR